MDGCPGNASLCKFSAMGCQMCIHKQEQREHRKEWERNYYAENKEQIIERRKEWESENKMFRRRYKRFFAQGIVIERADFINQVQLSVWC